MYFDFFFYFSISIMLTWNNCLLRSTLSEISTRIGCATLMTEVEGVKEQNCNAHTQVNQLYNILFTYQLYSNSRQLAQLWGHSHGIIGIDRFFFICLKKYKVLGRNLKYFTEPGLWNLATYIYISLQFSRNMLIYQRLELSEA